LRDPDDEFMWRQVRVADAKPMRSLSEDTWPRTSAKMQRRCTPRNVLDGWVVLEVVPIDRRFWPRGCGPDDFKKAARSGNTLPKGDPSGIA
jgi:hypothetical protein